MVSIASFLFTILFGKSTFDLLVVSSWINFKNMHAAYLILQKIVATKIIQINLTINYL